MAGMKHETKSEADDWFREFVLGEPRGAALLENSPGDPLAADPPEPPPVADVSPSAAGGGGTQGRFGQDEARLRGEQMTTETVDSKEPTRVRKRAIDVLPYVNAIWCTVAGSAPFANVIESRSWSEDGSKIWFMLGTHNFYDAAPEAEIEVVEVKCSAAAEALARWHEEDARKMAERPVVQPPCPTCGHQPPPKRGKPEWLR